MAADYIITNDGLKDAQAMQSAIRNVVGARRGLFGPRFDLFAVRDRMLKMRDGDGSQDAHYALVTIRFGTQSDAKSKTLFLEIDSVCAKLAGDGSATVAQLQAAIDQLEALTQA